MNTMLWKEWRETIRWSPIGMLGILGLLWYSRPDAGWSYGSYGEDLAGMVGITGAIAAGALALLQTLPELRADNRGFLLSRPLSRLTILHSKILAGAAVYGACVFVPLLIMYVWILIVSPQTHAIDPLEIVPAIIAAVFSFSAHTAVLWMVYRPARWLGTKWFPLLIPFPIVVAAVGASASSIWYETIPLLAIPTGLWLLLYLAARSAFVRLANLPPINTGRPRLQGSPLLLLLTCVIGVSIGGVVTVETIYSNFGAIQRYEQTSQSLDEQGVLHNVVSSRSRYGLISAEKTPPTLASRAPKTDADAAILAPPKPTQPRAEDTWMQEHGFVYVQPNRDNYMSPFLNTNIYSGGTNSSGTRYAAKTHRSGVFWLYRIVDSQRFAGFLYQSGIGAQGTTFSGIPHWNVLGSQTFTYNSQTGQQTTVSYSHPNLIVDREGVYVFDDRDNTLSAVLAADVDAFVAIPGVDSSDEIWIKSGRHIKQYEVQWDQPDLEEEIAGLKVRFNAKVAIELPDDVDLTTLVTLKDNRTVMRRFVNNSREEVFVFGDDGTLSELYQVAKYRNTAQLRAEPLAAACAPPGVLAGFGIFDVGGRQLYGPSWDEAAYQVPNPKFIPLAAALSLLHAILGIVLAWLACRRRILNSTATKWWMLGGAVLGAGTALAVIAIYPRSVTEPCENCDEDYRVDFDRCPGCSAERQPPPHEPIELLESARPVIATRQPELV